VVKYRDACYVPACLSTLVLFIVTSCRAAVANFPVCYKQESVYFSNVVITFLLTALRMVLKMVCDVADALCCWKKACVCL